MKRFIPGLLTASLFGTLLRFLYVRYPLPLFGVISPIRDSLWEQLKLLYLPFFLGAWAVGDRRLSFWGSVCITSLFLPLCFLFLLGIISILPGISLLSVYIVLYYVTLILGFSLLFFLRNREWTERQTGIFIMLAALWGCALLILSAYPPDWAPFR